MAIGYGLPAPKPEPRKRTKARKTRSRQALTKLVRAYVFEREKGICRCCGLLGAESMHEIIFRSQGGEVSTQNSIAVCGDGVRGCHGRLQRHEIRVSMQSEREGAQGRLNFHGQGWIRREWA